MKDKVDGSTIVGALYGKIQNLVFYNEQGFPLVLREDVLIKLLHNFTFTPVKKRTHYHLEHPKRKIGDVKYDAPLHKKLKDELSTYVFLRREYQNEDLGEDPGDYFWEYLLMYKPLDKGE